MYKCPALGADEYVALGREERLQALFTLVDDCLLFFLSQKVFILSQVCKIKFPSIISGILRILATNVCPFSNLKALILEIWLSAPESA